MGQPIAATVVYDDSSEQLFTNTEDALAQGDLGRIAYRFAYGPDLLPAVGEPIMSMWRYRDLLPLAPGSIRYPLAVGGTPLLASPGLRSQLAAPNLWLKDETRTPTGSNKDRATALVLETALRAGNSTVTCASTGNVAVSLAVGAAAAGMRAIIFVPAEVAESKLTLMLLAGATVFRVQEGYDAAFKLSRSAAQEFGWCDRNTGYNPLTLDAKKTVALEIWEQLGRELPDTVVCPVGDGPTLSAIAKGFSELIECGATSRLPRIVAVQAEGCQPLKRAWDDGSPVRAVEPDTIADGIAVGDPVSAGMVLRDVRNSGGAFIAVSDLELQQSMETLASKGGVLAEPAGAAAFAGLQQAFDRGLIARDERVVALVTGTAMKNLAYARTSNEAQTISANLETVRRAIELA